jgi:lipoic acid synthetase
VSDECDSSSRGGCGSTANVAAPAAVSLPILGAASAPAPVRRLPPWLRQNLAPGGGHGETAALIAELGLETVCSSAKCPNRLECWSQRTATFMILGNVCTRPCGFCSVPKGRTEAVEADEPERVAEAARRLGLAHVVITSVTRDDLPDGGAEHFRRTILAVRQATGAVIEVLVPDFLGKPAALERVMEAEPDVFNHNTETVPRLYRAVRGRKSVYAWTLEILAAAKRLRPAVRTKSGLMLGLGETRDELLDVLADLLDHGVDFLTLGQYLQPAADALPVDRYVPPEEFDELGRLARQMGFRNVASGPLVRSSYHAREMHEDGLVAVG